MPAIRLQRLVTRLAQGLGARLGLGAPGATHPARFRVVVLGLLAVVLLVTSLKYAAKIAKPADSGQQTRSAFLRWRSMIHEVFSGTNIYTGKHEYPNPPVMAIILRPFAELPPLVGAMSWFYAKVLMAVVAAVWVFRLLGDAGPTPPRPPSDAVKAAAVLLALPALTGDLTHNNVNIFILFLVTGCLELYRRGRDAAAGLVLGLAIACKLTPLLFLAYFGWKGAWRVVAGCLAGLALGFVLVPGVVLGWDRNAELLSDWYRLMIERPLLKGEVTTEHANQAVTGWVYRLFTHSPSFVGYEKTATGDIPTPSAYHNLVDIGRPAAWVVVKLVTAGFALAVVWLCRAPRPQRQGWRFAAECGLIALGMLLLSERTWKHHAVILLIPGAALAYAAAAEATRRVRGPVIACLVAALTLMTVPGLLGTRAGDLALVYGTHTLAFLLLTGATGAVLLCGLRRGDRAGPAPTAAIPD